MSERLIGAPILSLCQITAVNAMRMRVPQPAPLGGAASDAVREISNNLAYHLGLAEDVPLPPRVDVTGAMANLTQLHEARSQWEDIPSEKNGDAKPDDLAVAGQDVGHGA